MSEAAFIRRGAVCLDGSRSPHGAGRNAGKAPEVPDFAALHPVYVRLGLVAMLAAGLLLGVSSKGEAVDYVDLELLLAVDVSASVDSSEYSLQMTGIAEAFRHPDVIAAMRASAPHGIAVALLQWAGPDEQTYTVPWSIVRDGIASETFAARVDAATRPLTSGGTAIGDALIVGISLLAENSLAAARRVIDVSGDGRANQGTAPAPVRAQAVSLGVTVNGLAILNEEPQLMVYYAERVIGGSGAFVMHADDYEDFGRAIRLKLIREIEGASVAEAEPGDGTDARSSALVRGTRAVATPIGFARHGR